MGYPLRKRWLTQSQVDEIGGYFDLQLSAVYTTNEVDAKITATEASQTTARDAVSAKLQVVSDTTEGYVQELREAE